MDGVRRFRDRRDAGDRLAALLDAYRGREDLLVLGIPRGGVPVASRVAAALGSPLDVMVVRKLGVPGLEELAMGAIASGGVHLINQSIVRDLRITRDIMDAVAAREADELARRERAFRGSWPAVDPAGRTVILVDDGLATGSTMLAAVAATRQRRPTGVIMAVPVAPVSTCAEIEPMVDRLACVVRARCFLGVGDWYEDYTQTSDDEVRRLLREPPGPRVGPCASGIC